MIPVTALPPRVRSPCSLGDYPSSRGRHDALTPRREWRLGVQATRGREEESCGKSISSTIAAASPTHRTRRTWVLMAGGREVRCQG